jgi:hypothetical protein
MNKGFAGDMTFLGFALDEAKNRGAGYKTGYKIPGGGGAV